MLSEKLQALTERNFKFKHDRQIKKNFCSDVNSAVHGHKWRNLTMVYCNQRNNNDDDDDKFLILFTIDRVVNLPKRGLQSILYLLICCYFQFLQTDSWIPAMLQGRLWFRWGKGLFRKTNVFLQECCESELRLICQNQGLKDKQMIFSDFVGQFKIMFKVVKKNCNFPLKKEVRMFQFFHYWFCK